MSTLKTKTPIKGLIQECRTSGYAPFHNSLDADVTTYPESNKCECCNSVNVSYSGWKKVGSYRAFIICSDCGHELEF